MGTEPIPDWRPFQALPPGRRPPPTRPIDTPEGVGDRLRAAAFAELQAREAFRWAAGRYGDAPPALRAAWTTLAEAEDRHRGWLMARLAVLGADPGGRAVTSRLWAALTACADARAFAVRMAREEELGRRAGERFRRELGAVDPESAALFGRIAEEEVEHIRLAERFFPGCAAEVLR